MATIREIANKVGVSNATVSRVLNHDPLISVNEDTRKAILKAAEELQYKKKTIYPVMQNVALLYWMTEQEELEDLYFKLIKEEVEKQAKLRNITLTQYSREDGVEAVSPSTKAFFAIGRFHKAELEKLKKITPHGIFIDTCTDEIEFDLIRPNLRSMTYQMVDYFVEHGHKKIGFLGGCFVDIDTNEKSMDVREQAFRHRMQKYSLLDERSILISDSFSVKEGYRRALLAIAELGDDMPTAFCVGNDPLAIGALQAFNEKDWCIPQRVSFFSINDVGVAPYVSPPLTTFHIDIPLLCETAMNLLQERMLQGRMVTKCIYINGTAMIRKSCL